MTVGELVGVTLGVGENGVGDGDPVGLTTAVQVGVKVLGGMAVRVGVSVRIAVGLGTSVGVATGWLPIRTVTWHNRPRLPFTSRN